MTELKTDIAILGNGILGQSIAFELKQAQPDLNIVLIGPKTMPGGASVASGAMLGCFSEVTKYTFINPTAKAKFELSRRAHSLWPEWLKKLNAVSGQTTQITPGTYVICNSASGELDDQNFEAMLSALERYHQNVDDVSPTNIKGLNAVPTKRPLRAIYLPDEGSISSGELLATIEAANQKLGIDYLDSTWQDSKYEDGRLQRIALANGECVQADYFVTALGAFTQSFIDELPQPNDYIPSLVGEGIALVARRTQGQGFDRAIRTPNRAGACGLHLVPLGGGLEYVGATNTIATSPAIVPNVGRSHFLLQCAMDQLDRSLYFSEVIRWQVGNRPVTLDTYPALGWGQLDNLYLMYGTYRDGLHCSPEIARVVAKELLARKSPSDANTPFSPLRAPVGFGSRQDSIDAFVQESIDGAYENELQLPRYMSNRRLESNFQAMAQLVYNQMDADYAFAPDILHFLGLAANSTGKKKLTDYLRLKGGQ